MKPALYTKTFSRERSLMHNQAWYAGEASDARIWTKGTQPFMPYIVFHRAERTVDVYMDERGIEWVKSEILNLWKKDPQFIRREAGKYLSYVQSVQKYIDTTPALEIPELLRFVDGMRRAWPYLEVAWWGVEALESFPEYRQELDFLLDIRKKTEPETPANEAIILKSLEKAFPKHAKYTLVITREEAESGKLPEQSELEARLKGYVYTNDMLYAADALAAVENQFNIQLEKQADYSSVTTLKGRIANGGIARGLVRKVLSTRHLDAFLEGEILVTSSTVPDFLPAMIKAAAFVTDEGGLISHAAISAREMKKPCIIGTRIATQVLKDGDMVEVDADNGIVRVITRK